MSVMHEGPETQPLDTEFQKLVEPLAPPAEPEAPKKWPMLIVLVVAVAVALAGGVWWMLSSTVSQGDYDDVVAELNATEDQLSAAEAALAEERTALAGEQAALVREQAALADAEAALSSAQEQLTAALASSSALQNDFDALETSLREATDNLRATEGEVEALTSVSADLQARLGAIDPAVRLLAYIELDAGPEYFDTLETIGVDTTAGDELLATLGEFETWSEWSDASTSWITRDRALADLDDAEVDAAYERWVEAEIGSDAEWAAFVDMYLRLVQIIVEPVVGP